MNTDAFLDKIIEEITSNEDLAELAGKIIDRIGVTRETFNTFWEQLSDTDKEEFTLRIENE